MEKKTDKKFNLIATLHEIGTQEACDCTRNILH